MKKMNYKGMSMLGVALLALGGAAALTACGPTGSSTTPAGKSYKIAVSGPAAQHEWLEERLAGFKSSTGATVTFELQDHGEDKVDSEVTDWDVGPDVFAFASDKIMPLYQAGALGTLPKSGKDFITSTMGEEALNSVMFANKHVAYPHQDDNGYFLYYNKSLLNADQIKTMEGLLDAAKAGGYKVGYPLGTAYYSAGALFTFGARYSVNVNAAGVVQNVTADFDTEKGILAAKAMYKILSHEAWQETQAAPVATDKAAVVACVDGGWNATAYKEKMGDAFACAKLPTITVGDQTATLGSFLGYKMLGVNPQRSGDDVDRLAVCHEVAQYLAGKDVQTSRFEKFSAGPTNLEVKGTDAVKAAEHLVALNEQKPYSVAQTAVPGNIWSAPATLVTDLKAKIKAGEEITDAEYKTMMTALNDSIKSSK